MHSRISLIPGDGIGPEITRATTRVLEASGIEIDWDIAIVGEQALKEHGTPLPDSLVDTIKQHKLALKGPVTTPIGTGFRSVNVALRKKLDLFACVRPCRTFPGAPTPFRNVDIVIVRENTEDLYAGIEFAQGSSQANQLLALTADSIRTEARNSAGFSIKMISEWGSERIIRYAFEYAVANNRKKVTAAHKANIMKVTDAIFLNTARKVAQEYPQIEFDDVVIDALCMRLVRRPQVFDVIVLPNLYGDIVSDLCAGLIGGLGLAPGANIGDGIAVFEPSHGSAPKYTGKNKVNPMAMMLSAVMMLRYIGEQKAADRIERAIADVIAEGKNVTYDIVTASDIVPAGTSQVADAVIKKMEENSNAGEIQ